jgi:hypothetical protein
MRLKDITSISGMGGLYKMEVQRADGMIVKSLSEGWTKFVSSRKYLFTPLENIAIYTDVDTVPLLDVLLKMRATEGEIAVPASKASSDDLKAYMESILPDYDREKVYVSDIKKLIRWFADLQEHGVLAEEEKQATDNQSDESGEVSDVTDGDG